MKMRSVFAVAVVALAPAMALGQWSDNFDAYTVGTINGQGGWSGWDNTAAAAGQVTNNVFNSAPNSQMIQGGADSVQTYSGYTSGQWSYSADLFIPSSATGSTYFILLNDYNVPGAKNWSVELDFNLGTNLVYDDLESFGVPSAGSNSVPIVRDAWKQVRVDIDLDANTFSSYYDNALIYSGQWTRGSASGFQHIEAVDLFANGADSVFYDNMALTQIPAPGAGAVLAMAGLFGLRRRR